MYSLLSNKLKTVLSGKTASVLVILVIFAGRISQLSYLFNIRSDRSNQILAAQNLLTGHGISLAFSMPGNLSEVIYEPLIKWPPAYSFLYSPFYSLFNQNYIAAGLAIDIFFAAILVFVTRAILRTIGLPVYLINIYTLVTGFIIYSFYSKPSSDAVAITAFLFGVYFFLALLKSNKLGVLKTIGLIFSLLLCGSTKYLYIPIIFILPSLLFLTGWKNSNTTIRNAGIVSFLTLAFSIGALLVYQKITGGSAVYITQPNRGFFPENLLSLYPAVPSAIINPDIIRLTTLNNYNIATFIYRIFQLIHIAISFLLIVWSFRIIIKKGFKNSTLTAIFIYLTIFVLMAVTGLLATLSLNIEKEDGYWTYVQEARYYGLPVLLIQLSFFICYYCKRTVKIFKYAFLIGILFMLPDMFRGMLFSASRIINFNKETPSWKIEYNLQQYAEATIQKAKEKHSVNNVVLAGSSDYVNNRISIYSRIPQMKNIGTLNKLAEINTNTPTIILVVLRSDVLADFQPFLTNPNKEVAGYHNGFYFYTVYVKPH